jgi:hypothetical protein
MVGTFRRESLDHLIVRNDTSSRAIRAEFVAYYNPGSAPREAVTGHPGTGPALEDRYVTMSTDRERPSSRI